MKFLDTSRISFSSFIDFLVLLLDMVDNEGIFSVSLTFGHGVLPAFPSWLVLLLCVLNIYPYIILYNRLYYIIVSTECTTFYAVYFQATSTDPDTDGATRTRSDLNCGINSILRDGEMLWMH